MNLFDYIDKRGLLTALLEERIKNYVKDQGHTGDFDIQEDLRVGETGSIILYKEDDYFSLDYDETIGLMVNLYKELIRRINNERC